MGGVCTLPAAQIRRQVCPILQMFMDTQYRTCECLQAVLPDLGKFPNFGEILGKSREIFYPFGNFPKWEKLGKFEIEQFF
jgi:hypothetical protein